MKQRSDILCMGRIQDKLGQFLGWGLLALSIFVEIVGIFEMLALGYDLRQLVDCLQKLPDRQVYLLGIDTKLHILCHLYSYLNIL